MTTPPPPPPPSDPIMPSGGGLIGPENEDDKTMGMIAHGGQIIVGFWAPLLIMLIKKDSSFAQQESKEALNFAIICAIGYFISIILTFVCIGFVTMALIWIASIVFGIMGVVANNKGEAYRYPVNWRILK
jgi:uncharacterized Tic20 family protein